MQSRFVAMMPVNILTDEMRIYNENRRDQKWRIWKDGNRDGDSQKKVNGSPDKFLPKIGQFGRCCDNVLEDMEQSGSGE